MQNQALKRIGDMADPIESISPVDAQMALQAYRELIAGSCELQLEPGLTVGEASERYFGLLRQGPQCGRAFLPPRNSSRSH